MKNRWILISLLLLMTLAMAITAAAAEHTLFALIIAVFGLLWLGLLLFGQTFANDVFFILFVSFSAVGVFQRLSLPVLLAVVCLDIAVWNLANFMGQIQQVDKIIHQRQLEHVHLRRLGLTLAGGYLLGLVPILMQIEISFLALIVLTLLAVLLLGWGLMSLRKKDESNPTE